MRTRAWRHAAMVTVIALSTTAAGARAEVPTAPLDGSWTAVRLMDTGRPAPDERWIADAFTRYGNRGFDPTGLQVIYQVFAPVAGARTVAAIGYGKGCDIAPNDVNSGVSASQCPLTLMTVFADGRVVAHTTRPACFVWADPTLGPRSADPRTNATYMRYLRQTNQVQVVSVIDAKPQPGCTGSSHL